MAINWEIMRETDKAINDYLRIRAGDSDMAGQCGVAMGICSMLLSGSATINDVRNSIEKTISKEVRDEVHECTQPASVSR